jgi:hypothetical protein
LYCRSLVYRPNTRLSIAFANVTLSQTTETTRGDVVPIRSSRANLTAAMIEAQIAIVEAKRSWVRCSSSLALARFISPMLIAPAFSA